MIHHDKMRTLYPMDLHVSAPLPLTPPASGPVLPLLLVLSCLLLLPGTPSTIWRSQRPAGLGSIRRYKTLKTGNQIPPTTYDLFQFLFYTLGFCASLMPLSYFYLKSFEEVRGLLLLLGSALSVFSNC